LFLKQSNEVIDIVQFFNRYRREIWPLVVADPDFLVMRGDG
jgi:hypothetical protein